MAHKYMKDITEYPTLFEIFVESRMSPHDRRSLMAREAAELGVRIICNSDLFTRHFGNVIGVLPC